MLAADGSSDLDSDDFVAVAGRGRASRGKGGYNTDEEIEEIEEVEDELESFVLLSIERGQAAFAAHRDLLF